MRGRIVDEKDNEVPPGEEGRLQVKGSSSLRCYWNNEEKTSQTIQHGWVNTGDSYRVDEEGFFVYGGRSDDMMKVGGIWCSACLLYTSPSPRDRQKSRMPSSA